MKKLASLLMSGLLVFSLASCQSTPQDPAEAYKAACEKTATLTATDYDATIAAQVEASGMSMNIDMDIGMKLDMKDKQNPKMALDLSTSLFGQSVEGSLVCTDGTCYVSSMGEKSKFAYTAEDLTSVGLDKGISMDFSLPEGTEITTKQENGNTVYCFEVSGEELAASSSFLMDSFTDSMGTDNQIGTITCEMSVNSEGYIVRQLLTIPVTTSQSGIEMTMNMTFDMNLTNYGDKVSITAPEDASSYPEGDAVDFSSLFSFA